MTFVNLTPHEIKLNDGTVISPSGKIARVSSRFTNFDADKVCSVEYGEIEDLPEPTIGVFYVVSSIVLAATDRKDVVAPATGHPATIRKDGQIVSVPGFVQ